MSRQAAEALKSVRLEGTTAVIIGATAGIGAAVARRFSQLGCSRIFTLGRNQARGESGIEEIRTAAPSSSKLETRFIPADLSTIEGMHSAASAIEQAAGPSGINYLILSAGSPANGTYRETVDGIDERFATQVVSRFVMSYLAASNGALADGAVVISIAAPGRSLDDLDAEDLSLKRRFDAGRWAIPLFLDQTRRNSTVIDSFTEELNAHYPRFTFFHVSPGVVYPTNVFANADLPFPLGYLAPLSLVFKESAEDYSNIPVYMAAKPQNFGEGHFYDNKLRPVPISKWSSVKENRLAVWKTLKAMVTV